MVDQNYESLRCVLDRAYDQAAYGKGKERHASGEAFVDQLIVKLGVYMGHDSRFNVGQSCKKAIESLRLPRERAVSELLGAINYLAGAVLIIEGAPKSWPASSVVANAPVVIPPSSSVSEAPTRPLSEMEHACFFCGGPTKSTPGWCTSPETGKRTFFPANCLACCLREDVVRGFAGPEEAWASFGRWSWRELQGAVDVLFKIAVTSYGAAGMAPSEEAREFLESTSPDLAKKIEDARRGARERMEGRLLRGFASVKKDPDRCEACEVSQDGGPCDRHREEFQAGDSNVGRFVVEAAEAKLPCGHEVAYGREVEGGRTECIWCKTWPAGAAKKEEAPRGSTG